MIHLLNLSNINFILIISLI